MLETLEVDSVQRRKRKPVFDPDSGERHLAILKSGWAVSRSTTPSGQSTITQIYMAGDMIGLSDLAFAQPPHSVFMQTDGAISLVPRARLLAITRDHPRLLVGLLSLASLSDAALHDRLHAVSRLSAEDRLIHFILSIKSRAGQLSEQMSDRFPMFLSQKDIGDALGLTDIYVNRLLRRLVERGELAIDRPYLRIADRKAWERRVNFTDRYSAIDPGWLDLAS